MNDLSKYKDSAVKYVEMGYSITPIVKGTKANFRQKWSTEAINDIESAKRWWNRYPNDNIAIITGKRSKNLLIIDVDRKNSEDGTKAIKEWESQHDKLPKTLMATTPNNGLHYYYFIGDDLLEEADKYIKNKSKYYEGIDVRYNGGLIVAPPSTTKNGEYKWKNKGIPIAYANENVIDFLKNGVVNKTNNTFSGDVADKKINNNLGKTKGVTVVCGNRNTSLASYIGSLHAQGYSDNTICKMAYIYNSENCIDNEGNSNPLPVDEVERTLKSILSRPKGFLKLNSTEENIKQFLFKLKPEINYSWDDKGNGKLFSDIFINTFRYNKEAKMWYFYNGKYWDKDVESITAKKYAIYLSRALEAYSFYMEEGERKEEYQKFLKGLGKIITRDNMVKDAMKYSAISYADLDKNKNLFNCLNGTYDLENYTLRPHQAEDLISKVSNVVYDPNAKSEIWDKFINDIMINDDEKIAYIQRILGYALTASTKEETAFILYGSTTRNGKSTLIETYAFLLGGSSGYGSFAQPETLAQTKRDSRAPSEDLASLRGARFLALSEPPKGMVLDSALLKQLVGGDTIKARGIFEKTFTYKPDFKIFINTNHLPDIYDNTLFAGEKLWVIPFERHFTQKEQDKDLKRKLTSQQNISGIFNWCLAGLAEYSICGLNPPDSIKKATNDYANTIDKIGNFIQDCLIYDTDKYSDGSIVYSHYQSWCKANGYATTSNRTFYQDLKDKGIIIDSGKINGKKIRNRLNYYVLANPLEFDNLL